MLLDISDVIGEFGIYHFIVLLVTVLRALPSAWTLTGIDFLTGDFNVSCTGGSFAESIHFGKSVQECLVHPTNGTHIDTSVWVDCVNFTYGTVETRWSVVPEWNLVCQKRWISSAMQTLVFAGCFVGAIVFGLLSDWQGRRKSLLVSTILFAVFAIGSSVVPELWAFNLLRFVQAAAVAGIQVTSAALFMELLLPRDRYLMNVGFTIAFAACTIAVPFVSQALNSWRLFQLVCGLCALCILPPLLIVEESPRWLVNQKRTLEAREVLNSIFTTNRRSIPNFTYVMSSLVERSQSSESQGILVLLGNPRLRRQLIIILLYWLVENGIYYADIFLSAHIPDLDPRTTFAIGAAAEIPAGIVGMFLLRFLNRRSSMAGSLAIGSACSIATAFLSLKQPTLKLALSSVTRFFLTVATSIKWVYTLELLPTNIRSLGFALAFAVGRIGGMLAPFIRDLALASVSNQKWCFVIVGSGSFLATVLVFFLPETLNSQLPDSIFESFLRNRRRSQSLPRA
ncbi:organic cation transporter protein [Galendromus occidentalis]|uniref:Organic cation transporter protein n=1 Tax=Galendromus occidentalis TaxID=34638 RepID=A0AAJ6VWC1_9ACAR|nr:organic cation transporter protein [Galendromus occidentalis]